jgi:hypothetical protein
MKDSIITVMTITGAEYVKLKQGYDRYEFVRTLTPMKFKALWHQNINNSVPFDDIVDSEILTMKY